MSWNKYDPENSNGPVSWFTKIIGLVFVLSLIVGAASFTLGWFDDGAKVAQEQLYPSALLKKYEWFKDAHAQLEAKRKNIQTMESREQELIDAYLVDGKATPRIHWLRSDAEQFNLWESEIAGLKANYNDLAAQYNAQMSKINYRFTNVGDIPGGSDEPLPRNIAPYID